MVWDYNGLHVTPGAVQDCKTVVTGIVGCAGLLATAGVMPKCIAFHVSVFNDVFLLGKKMPATRDTWPILTVADLGFFQIFSREKESAGWSDSIYILYIDIIYMIGKLQDQLQRCSKP